MTRATTWTWPPGRSFDSPTSKIPTTIRHSSPAYRLRLSAWQMSPAPPSTFRGCFQETIPESCAIWTSISMTTHRCGMLRDGGHGTWIGAVVARQGRRRSGDGRELHPSSVARGHVAPSRVPEGPFRRAPRALLPVALCPEALTRYDLPATAQTTIRKAFEARSRRRYGRFMSRGLISNYLIPWPTCPPGGLAFFAG